MRDFNTNDTFRGGSAHGGARSILVVEHEELLALDIQSTLQRFGFDVPATASSEAEALEALETFHPDLVVIDVRLEKGGDGIAAAAAIRARHPTPIVLLSSENDEATLHRAQQEAQPNGYVLRPYQDNELRAAVEVALQRHNLEQETSQQRSLLAGVLSAMSDAVITADVDGRVVLVNESGRRAFGNNPVADQSVSEGAIIYLPDQRTVCPSDELPLVRALRGEMVRDVDLFIQTAQNPEGRRYSVNATPLLDVDGLVCGAVAVGRDLTELRVAHRELQEMARTDALTGAYNRFGFMQAARDALETARQSGSKPAVFFIDLNGMKRINDSLGHLQGDQLLSDVMTILRECFRSSDIIGRLGGDEFVVLSPDAGETAESFRGRLRVAVDDYNARSKRSYRVSISVGLATESQVGPVGLEDLVEQADKRMYEDKQLRRARRPGDTLPPPGDLDG
ncbi:MAG TPA: diguanylate cyclase [Polyangiaceae bacterium]|jgi:diguanylate cyclase (GGDEF)-like protein